MDLEVIIATHDGGFHADDCFAVAVLLILLETKRAIPKIKRTRDPEQIAGADFVVDVGGAYDPDKNRFDHHQPGRAGRRPGGPSFASFGLVWKQFGVELCGSGSAAVEVDRILVAPVDAQDNGEDICALNNSAVAPYSVSDALGSFEPTYREKDETVGEAFLKAVAFARRILEREIARAKAFVESVLAVERAYLASPDKQLVILSEPHLWERAVEKFPELLFIVVPSQFNTDWKLYAVRERPPFFKNKKDLPAAWAGLRDEELAKVTGVPDAVFCSTGRFIAVAKTKEGAIKLAEQALKE